MKTLLVSAVLLLCCAVANSAQELVGKYSGYYTRSVGGEPSGIDIQITSAVDGKLKGALTLYQQNCGGTFPFEGTYTNNKVEATTAGGGRARGCHERRIEAVVEGNRLMGRLLGQRGNWVDINLSK